MSHLHLVPPAQPTGHAKLREKIKRMPNVREVLQCRRCGSRSYMTIWNGGNLIDGRMKHGTVIERCICADCYRHGLMQSVLPPKFKRIE